MKPQVFLYPGLQNLERAFLNGVPKNAVDYLLLELAWREWVHYWALVVEARLVTNRIN